MNRLWTLFKTLRKANAGISGQESDQGEVVSQVTIFMYMFGIAIVLGLAFFGYKGGSYIDLIGGQPVAFGLLSLLAGMVAFILGGFKMLNSMYMSSDIDVIIVMPFSAMEIVLTRVLNCASLPVVGTLALLLPLNIGYSLYAGFNVTMWIAIVLACILIPVFSLCVAGTLLILLMSFVKVLRSRDVMKYIGVGIGFILLCVYIYYRQQLNHAEAQDIVTQMASFSQKIAFIFPPAYFLGQFGGQGNIVSLLIGIGSTGLVAAIFYLCGQKWYLNSAMNMRDSTNSGKQLSLEDVKKMSKQKSVLQSLITRDYRQISRTPALLLNTFLVPFLWPILMVITMNQVIKFIPSLMKESESMAALFGNVQFEISCMLVAVFLFITGYVLVSMPVAYTAISREGQDFMMMKLIPVSYREQIKAKQKLAYRLALITTTGYIALFSIALISILHLPILSVLAAILVQVIFVVILINIDMLYGLKNINLDWDNERDIMAKANFTCAAFGLVIGFVLPFGFGGVGLYLLTNNAYVTLATVGGIVLVIILAIVAFILHRQVLVYGEKRLNDL